jgi:predicted nucleic acid-binding protein
VADVYALDTNVYIRALRDARQLAILKRFLIRVGTRVRVSAVVALELRMGAHTDAQASGVEELIRPYSSRDRVVVPSFEAFMQAGRVVSALTVRERMSAAYAPSLTNDAIVATSCREADVVLVTENTRDFTAIKRQLRGFRFVDSTALASSSP